MELSNANHHRKKWRKNCFYFHIFYFFIPAKGLAVSLLGLLLLSVSAMSIKIKGIYKSFKYISQIFVVKEREMEIGHPTDVKHVAHIGWDGSSGSAPSWMGKFRPPSDGERRDSNPISLSTWSSQARSGDMFKDIGPDDVPKKTRRKKSNSCSSAKTSKESRSAKPKAKYSNIERQRNVL